MFSLGAATRIYLAAGATDMRKGFNGLMDLAQGVLDCDPLTGHVFVFCNRARNRLKVLYWDGNGLWVCAKRLEGGRYSWPALEADRVRAELSHQELTLLLGGVELERSRQKNWWRTHAKGSA